MKSSRFAAALFACLAFAGGVAQAHPHVFVTASIAIRFDAAGKLAGVDETMTFDEIFSTFSTQGLGSGDGKLTREELAPLAKTNVTAMKEFDYYTYASHGKEWRDFDDPTDYWLEDQNGLLVLHFFLPFKDPQPVKDQLFIDVRDPTIYVAFKMTDQDPVKLVDAPPGCSVEPPKPDPDAGYAQRNRSTITCK